MSITIMNSLSDGLSELKRNVEVVSQSALEKVGIQLINFIINGSENIQTAPPILHGVLRGSGSVFVGAKKVHDTKSETFTAVKEPLPGTPADTCGESDDSIISIVFNTPYAARWHEEQPPYGWGDVSRKSGDVGYKYVEQHLYGDAKELMEYYAALIKKGLGT